MRKLMLIVLICAIVVFAVQVFLLIRDRKKNASHPAKFSPIKIVPFGLGVVGLLTYFLSWIEIPIVGGISFFKLFGTPGLTTASDFDSSMLIYGVLLFFTLGLMVTGAIFQLAFRIAVKSLPTLIFEVALGAISTVLGILTIYTISHIFDGQATNDPFGAIFQQYLKVSPGVGILLLTAIGTIYAVYVLLMQRRNVLALKAAPPTPFDELRELKKLLDEGVITQEEFEKKKSEML